MFKALFAVSLISMFNGGFNRSLGPNQLACRACYAQTPVYQYNGAPYGNYGLGGHLKNLGGQLGSHLGDLTFELPGLIAKKTWLETKSYFKGFSSEDQMNLNQVDARIGQMEYDSDYLRGYGAYLAGVRF